MSVRVFVLFCEEAQLTVAASEHLNRTELESLDLHTVATMESYLIDRFNMFAPRIPIMVMLDQPCSLLNQTMN